MLFVLSDEFIIKLCMIRDDYEKRAGIILDETQQPYAISRFFGAKDIKTRNIQINLLEKWLSAFKKDLLLDKLTLEELQNLIKKLPKKENSEPTTEKSRHKNEWLAAFKKDLTDQQCSLTEVQNLIKRSVEEKKEIADKLPDGASPFAEPTAQAIENQVTALRVLATVCMYIKSEIDSTYSVRSGSSAILEQLINEAMGITSSNIIDQETRACCLLATQRYLKERGRFEAINAQLQTRFTEKQWHDFLSFVDKECAGLSKKYKTQFPVKDIMMPLMGKPLELAGYTSGFILGEMVSKSTKLLKTQHALTAAIGSGLVLCLGPSASIGVILLAPTYASRILDTFCGVTLAWALGTAGNIVGQGLGFGVGVSVDLSWKLMYHSVTLLASLYAKTRPEEKLTGICLINGHRIVDGIELKVVDLESLPPECQLCPITFEVDEKELKVTVNEDHTTVIPWEPGKELLYMEELKKYLTAHAYLEASANLLQSPDIGDKTTDETVQIPRDEEPPSPENNEGRVAAPVV
ncbi:hypothetical protein [Legionella cardiaca]|uniref:Substrate of the Dot/Icm secretion system n=1 Tax=Legionella cardiaca TaxID=1071983 RepID=A0ABY8AWV8_9GAMM|nr:hypothetical protein [Legionella cardiaca]WED43911.1 hypothetical protein PXX05_03760 [Legionella cardiaca]